MTLIWIPCQNFVIKSVIFYRWKIVLKQLWLDCQLYNCFTFLTPLDQISSIYLLYFFLYTTNKRLDIWSLGCPNFFFFFFCESWQVKDEVIIKWFYLYYFRFCQLFDWALLKNQNQHFFTWSAVNLRNAAENLF